MDIKTFADLAKLADICRKKGIKAIKVTQDAIEFQLSDKPEVRHRNTKAPEVKNQVESEEEMLFWSSTGIN